MSIFFPIDLEIIRTIRSEDFSFDFAENISKFVIFRGDIRKIMSLCKFCRVTKKSRFIQSLVGKIIGKLAVSEIVLFDELSNKWKATERVADVFK